MNKAGIHIAVLSVLLFVFLDQLAAQQKTTRQLQDSARLLMQQGDVENAVKILEQAYEQSPANAEILRDLSFGFYLKRDFARAIEIGKEAVGNANADAQAYQVLGLSYKAIAAGKECAKLYKTGLQKFPRSGVLYNEYAELLAVDGKINEAIAAWEKGISADPGYSNNYYNATKYYIRSGNWTRAIIYGELFVNLESFTTHTDDIKSEILNAYRNCLTGDYIRQAVKAKVTSLFEKNILEILSQTAGPAKDGITLDNLFMIRTRFIHEWMASKDKLYPFRLFSHQQYLLSQGLFEAYNQWIFAAAINADAGHLWQINHPGETAAFQAFQQSRVFKMPAGQYYF
jgi:tetratricopeptide (TPR) repeat protein